MRTETSRQECDYCERVTKHERDIGQPNHILHLLASVFTAGLWIPVWVYLSVTQSKGKWSCSQCGSVPESEITTFGETMGFAAVIAFVIAAFMLFLVANR